MPFRTLDPDKILITAQKLEARVAGRFPNRGLRGVAAELVLVTEATMAETRALVAPIWWLRLLIAAIVLAGAAVFLRVGNVISLDRIGRDSMGSVQNIEAAINTLVLGGLGLTALVRLEARLKRQRVALGLHSLRSIIHVIDMHQLTKDPVALTATYVPTAQSPDHMMEPGDLARYLDYCSEMLAITGKLAALYAQSVREEAVAQAVNDIETLGSSLSRKIWQKIMMIDAKPALKPRRTAETPD